MNKQELADKIWKLRNCTALTTVVLTFLSNELAKEAPPNPFFKNKEQ